MLPPQASRFLVRAAGKLTFQKNPPIIRLKRPRKERVARVASVYLHIAAFAQGLDPDERTTGADYGHAVFADRRYGQ
jgi:hypothetical protein